MLNKAPRLVRILILLVAAVLACGRERQSVARDDAIRHHLNQRDYERAIALLKERIGTNPSDDTAKILLASAYSGSVGINTIDCFEALRPALFDLPATSLEPTKEPSAAKLALVEEPESLSPEEQKRKAILVIEREFYKFASQMSDAFKIAFLLPHIALSDRDRIVLSLSILGEIDESSDQYLTAQLYQGILSIVQFMNYFRDGLPPGYRSRGQGAWYVSLYCQIDLGILMPNLSRAIDYITLSLVSFDNAGRKSNNPIYRNFQVAKQRLSIINGTYLRNQDLFDFGDWAIRVSKESVCV